MTGPRTRRFAAVVLLLLAGCDRHEPDPSPAQPSGSVGSPRAAAPSGSAPPL